jgi:hypothetical protein
VTGVQTCALPISDEVWNSYLGRKRNPNTEGLWTFLQKIDDASRGVKPGELWLVAAYVAQGKSTFTANLAYNGIYQGLNGLFVPLEMTFAEIRDLEYALHASCPDWELHPKFKKMMGKLPYNKIRYGELSSEEEEFFEAVKNDFGTSEKMGRLKIVQPPQPLTPALLELYALDCQAELAEQGKTLDFLIVDYVGLMVPDKNDKYGEYNADLNNNIRKLKNLALSFNNGKGLRTITPFQTNREGWKDACKNEGIYKLTALSNANEADRSSDLVISLFMSDEMKKMGIMKVCCLKKRRGEDFVPFECCIDWTSMRTKDSVINTKQQSPNDSMAINDLSNEIPMDVA